MNLFTTMEQQQNNNKTAKKLSYENGKIYKIVSSKGDMIYIGSTAQKYLSQRYTQHISSYKFYKKNGTGKKKGMSSFILFDAYGIENCTIELIDYCPCKTKTELERQEFMYINSISCVNKQKTFNEHPLIMQQSQLHNNSKKEINNETATSQQKNIKASPEPFSASFQQTINKLSTTSQPKFRWVWSKDYKVQRMVRVHEEYAHRAVPSIHKYNIRNALTDIRDRFSPSRDKEFSYLNCNYFHTSIY